MPTIYFGHEGPVPPEKSYNLVEVHPGTDEGALTHSVSIYLTDVPGAAVYVEISPRDARRFATALLVIAEAVEEVRNANDIP